MVDGAHLLQLVALFINYHIQPQYTYQTHFFPSSPFYNNLEYTITSTFNILIPNGYHITVELINFPIIIPKPSWTKLRCSLSLPFSSDMSLRALWLLIYPPPIGPLIKSGIKSNTAKIEMEGLERLFGLIDHDGQATKKHTKVPPFFISHHIHVVTVSEAGLLGNII